MELVPKDGLHESISGLTGAVAGIEDRSGIGLIEAAGRVLNDLDLLLRVGSVLFHVKAGKDGIGRETVDLPEFCHDVEDAVVGAAGEKGKAAIFPDHHAHLMAEIIVNSRPVRLPDRQALISHREMDPSGEAGEEGNVRGDDGIAVYFGQAGKTGYGLVHADVPVSVIKVSEGIGADIDTSPGSRLGEGRDPAGVVVMSVAQEKIRNRAYVNR